MARAKRNAKIDTPHARTKLAARREPYWSKIDHGFYLGYRRAGSGGTWVARIQEKRTGAKTYRAIGNADDQVEANGATVLSWSEAQTKARDWFNERGRTVDAAAPSTGPVTIQTVIDQYVAYLQARKKPSSAAEAKRTAANWITPTLGTLRVEDITKERLDRWHVGISATAPMRKQSKTSQEKPAKAKAPTLPADDESVRKRRLRANRVLSVLRAAFNMAWRDKKIPKHLASEWHQMQPFEKVERARVRFLSEDEQRRLVNACEPEFRPLVQAALLTGCRYNELATLHAGDYVPAAGILSLRITKGGKPRHVILTEEAQAFFTRATVGLESGNLVFVRAPRRGSNKAQGWKKSEQHRPIKAACKAAKIAPAISFHILRHTHGSTLAMNGVPLSVIAEQLGHSDTRLTERHYAHLAPSYIADTIRANFPTLGITAGDNVATIAERGRR